MLSQKKTNCYSLTHHIWNVTKLPCKMQTFFIFFIFFTHIEHQSVTWTSCGSVLLQHGLDFTQARWMMQLISGKKDWKHVSVQKVATLNICCDVACLTFHLPNSTTGSFQSHQCQPTTGFFQRHQRLEECNIPSVRGQSCAFYKTVRWHFKVWWVRG